MDSCRGSPEDWTLDKEREVQSALEEGQAMVATLRHSERACGLWREGERERGRETEFFVLFWKVTSRSFPGESHFFLRSLEGCEHVSIVPTGDQAVSFSGETFSV